MYYGGKLFDYCAIDSKLYNNNAYIYTLRKIIDRVFDYLNDIVYNYFYAKKKKKAKQQQQQK